MMALCIIDDALLLAALVDAGEVEALRQVQYRAEWSPPDAPARWSRSP